MPMVVIAALAEARQWPHLKCLSACVCRTLVPNQPDQTGPREAERFLRDHM